MRSLALAIGVIAATVACRSAPAGDELVMRVDGDALSVHDMDVVRSDLVRGAGPFWIEASESAAVRAVVFDDANRDGELQATERSRPFPAVRVDGRFKIAAVKLSSEQLSQFPPDRTMLGFEVVDGGRRHFRANRVP